MTDNPPQPGESEPAPSSTPAGQDRPPPPPTPPGETPGPEPPAPSSPPSPPGLAQAPPPVAGQRAGSGPAPAAAGAGGWYNGPLPIQQLAPRETVGSAIGRTAVKSLTALIIIGGGLFLIPIALLAVLAGLAGVGGADLDDPPSSKTFVAGDRSADVNLVAVPISGVILGEDTGGGGGFFGAIDATYGYTVKEQLAELADDNSVDGVILEIDSPGGTIFGSRAIADGVEAYRAATDKPIFAYVSGISASGGVYAMAGADMIYADHGTLVGSIGVIFGPLSTYDGVTAIDGGILGGGVTTEGGIEVEYLSAGRSKDFGNPYRPITAEERSVFQEGLDDAYADFVGHVSKGRDIPVSAIEDDLGALIFGEQQAVANGLIDGVADRDSSYELAAKAAGLGTDETWRVERLERGSGGLLDLLAETVFDRNGDETRGGDQPGAVPALCLGTGSVLAYHGDPLALCR